MRYIEVSVPTFNVLKYIVIVLVLTPLTEFATKVTVCALAKTTLFLTGSVTVSDSRAGFWGLHSYYLGQGWIGKLLIFATASWLIASELMFEFSFTAQSKVGTESNRVWATIPAPSWQEVVDNVFQDTKDSLEYYGSALATDYDLLYDGIALCPSATFREEINKKEKKVTIRQVGEWARFYRSTDKVQTLCGADSPATLTSVLMYDDLGADINTVSLASILYPVLEEPTPKNALRRFRQHCKGKRRFWDFDIPTDPMRIYISENRVVCVRPSSGSSICVMQWSESYVLYGAVDYCANKTTLKEVGEFLPQRTQRDPLLNLAESMAVVATIGNWRLSPGKFSGYALNARQLREIMQVFLSLDSNGGITRHEATADVAVRGSTASVIYVNSYAFIAAGLWGSLMLLLSVVFAGCHILANRHRKKYGFGEKRVGRLALEEMRFNFSNGFLFEKVKHDWKTSPGGRTCCEEQSAVEFRLVNDREKQQMISVLGDEEGVPRNYALELNGFANNLSSS